MLCVIDMCSNNLASIEVAVNWEHTWPFKRNAEDTDIGYIGWFVERIRHYKLKITYLQIPNLRFIFNLFTGQIGGITNLCRGLSLISILEILYLIFVNPYFHRN